MTSSPPEPTRRRFIQAGTAAAATAVSAVGTASAQSGGDYGGWFGSSTGGETQNYDGTTADKTGQSEVTIQVGANGNGGTYAFSPPAVKISPGTKVQFEWVSNTHNIKIQEKPSGSSWQGESAIKNKGYSYSHTFQTEGAYKYYCEPHLSLGMKGVIVVASGGGGSGGGGSADWGDWFTGNSKGAKAGNYDGTTADKTGQSEVTIQVGANGNGGTYAFSPPAVKIDPGTKVTFNWVSNTHNIVVEKQPSGANWQGESDIKDKGYSYSHTFQTSGTYEYYCDPHLSLGMKGGIFVTGSAGGSGGGGGSSGGGGSGGGGSSSSAGGISPFTATWMFGPAVVALLATAWYFIDDYRYRKAQREPETPTTPPETIEAARREPDNPIPHDEYDPWGTATLIAAYLVIISIAWILMYFVEFLGHGPHILG